MGHLTQMNEEMRLRRFSETTIQHYTSWVRRFAAFHRKRPDRMGSAEVRAFLLHVLDRGVRPTTHHMLLSSLRFFFRLHGREGVMAEFPRPRRERRVPQVPSEGEICRILNACRSLRDKAFFHLLYASGLRLGEARGLRVSDLDLVRRQVYVRFDKNRRDRYSILGKTTVGLFKEYLEHYRPPEETLFFCLGLPGRPWGARSIQTAFERARTRSGVERHFTIHHLRHAFATHLVEQNVNLFSIMRLLGHTSIATTQVYLGVSNLERIQVTSPADLIGEGLDLGCVKESFQLFLPAHTVGKPFSDVSEGSAEVPKDSGR